MSDPQEVHTNVRYRNGEPEQIDVVTERWESNYSYQTTYRFRVNGSTAVLSRIEPDGEYYMVQANAETRVVAEETVRELPFVQGAVMFE